MRVRMLTTAAGPAGVWMAGSIQEVSDEQGRHFVDGGYAEAIPVPPAPRLGPEPEPVAETPEPVAAEPTAKKKGPRGRR
jgi:predicted patatin/cPLA2 family phospholipase